MADIQPLGAGPCHAAGLAAGGGAGLFHRLGRRLQFYRSGAGGAQIHRLGLGRASRITSGCLPARGFLDALWTTVIFTFFSAIVGQSVLGFMLAITLRGTTSMLKSVVEVAIMLGWLLPDIVAAFLWSATAAQTGLVNSLIIVPLGFEPVNFINEYALPVVILANIWKGTAWSYLLFSAALDSVSREVVEAARVDGATPFQRICPGDPADHPAAHRHQYAVHHHLDLHLFPADLSP